MYFDLAENDLLNETLPRALKSVLKIKCNLAWTIDRWKKLQQTFPFHYVAVDKTMKSFKTGSETNEAQSGINIRQVSIEWQAFSMNWLSFDEWKPISISR